MVSQLLFLLITLHAAVCAQDPPSPLSRPPSNPDDVWYYHMDVTKNEVTHFEHFSELNPRSALLCPRNFHIAKIVYNFHDRLTEEEAKLRKDLHIAAPKYAFTNSTLETGHLLETIETDFILGHDAKLLNRTNHNQNAHVRGVNKLGGLADISSKHLPAMGVPLRPVDTPNLQNEQILAGGKQEVPLQWPATGHKHGPCPTLVYCLGHQSCSFHLSNKFCQNDPVPGWRKTLDVWLTCEHDKTFPEKIKMAAAFCA